MAVASPYMKIDQWSCHKYSDHLIVNRLWLQYWPFNLPTKCSTVVIYSRWFTYMYIYMCPWETIKMQRWLNTVLMRTSRQPISYLTNIYWVHKASHSILYLANIPLSLWDHCVTHWLILHGIQKPNWLYMFVCG